MVAIVPLLLVGCDSAKSDTKQVAREDPTGEFEWGMERLKRALHDFAPSGAGLEVTDRQVTHELFPPDEKNSNYRARITVTTETAFLHRPRSAPAEPKEEKPEEKLEVDDPLSDPNDELSQMVENGPKSPLPPVDIEPRTTKSVSEFEMAYIKGRWQLTAELEKKLDRQLFDYAFN